MSTPSPTPTVPLAFSSGVSNVQIALTITEYTLWNNGPGTVIVIDEHSTPRTIPPQTNLVVDALTPSMIGALQLNLLVITQANNPTSINYNLNSLEDNLTLVGGLPDTYIGSFPIR